MGISTIWQPIAAAIIISVVLAILIAALLLRIPFLLVLGVIKNVLLWFKECST